MLRGVQLALAALCPIAASALGGGARAQELRRLAPARAEAFRWPLNFSVREAGSETQWGAIGGNGFKISDLKNHPAYTPDESKAKVVFAVVPDGPPGVEHNCSTFVDELINIDLPERSESSPWIIWARCLKEHSLSEDTREKVRELLQRKDVLFAYYDRTEYFPAKGEADPPVPFRGVTFPPPMATAGKDVWDHMAETALGVANTRKYLMFFRGTITSKMRENLTTAFSTFSDPRVTVDFAGEHPDQYVDELINSSFALVPEGSERWNFRFSEVLLACTIPVIMADGLTLPFEDIIDWSKVSIRVNGSYATDASGIVSQLITDPKTIEDMRRKLCQYRDQYFIGTDQMLKALLLSLDAHLQNLRL